MTTINTLHIDTQALTEWAQNFTELRDREGLPIINPVEPRAQLMLENARNDQLDGPSFPPSFIHELLSDEPEAAGELYFTRFVKKPEPPIEKPSWAETKKIFWGFPAEVELEFKSKIFTVDSWEIYWVQMASIQLVDDETREGLGTPVLHESPIEFTIFDGHTSIKLDGDVDLIGMLAAAMEDSVRLFTQLTPKELKRCTEPGEPDHRGLGGGL